MQIVVESATAVQEQKGEGKDAELVRKFERETVYNKFHEYYTNEQLRSAEIVHPQRSADPVVLINGKVAGVWL